MVRPGPTTWGAIGGAVAGLALCGVLLASGFLDDDADEPEAAPQVTGEAAIDAFVDAWEARLTGTYVVESTFTRELAAGGGFTSPALIAQRPPERLQVQFGSVQSRRSGEVTSCTTDDQGTYQCAGADPELTFAQETERELTILRAYVEGDRPLYDVVVDDAGCFVLTQHRPVPSPPYGTEATFCFDEDTGAPTFVRIVRPEGTDTTNAVDVRAEVTDADLEPPSDGDVSTDPVPTETSATTEAAEKNHEG